MVESNSINKSLLVLGKVNAQGQADATLAVVKYVACSPIRLIVTCIFIHKDIVLVSRS